MAHEFIYDQIKEHELRYNTPFLGYFSPNGEVYSFNDKNNIGTHYLPSHPVPQTYLKYISYVINNQFKNGSYGTFLKENKPEQYKELVEEDIDELVFRNYDSYNSGIVTPYEEFYKELLVEVDELTEKIRSQFYTMNDKFKLDLLKFFVDAYKEGSFIKSTGRKTRIDSPVLLEKKLLEENNIDRDMNIFEINNLIEKASSKQMLTFFKDICVRILGYDSIEKFDVNEKELVIPEKEEDYDKFFFSTPRVITTSHYDIFDRYYNYILMDWYIKKVPRQIYNDKTGKFEEELPFVNTYIEQKEEAVREELLCLRKAYSPKERIQFMRK